MSQVDPLIHTKLHPPYIRPGLVHRPRLQKQIIEGTRGPLTLVTAPAGFGKTTLVAAGVSGCDMPIAWLSLNKEDNQDGHFLAYLIAALQTANPQVGKEAVQLMAEIQLTSPEVVLTSLLNDLDNMHTEMVLILDDYQFISNPAVHANLTFLLEHCPPTFHVLIVTRSDPPIPLSRLRARGQLVELRAAELRFTPEEAGQFLNDVMSLNLDPAAVSVLEERTEGWIAGLQMAALALQSTLSARGRNDLGSFIHRFSGTNRYILDYLLEEVLTNLPPEIHYFLHCTSILESLTAPLCQAVLSVIRSEVGAIERLPTNFLPASLENCQATLEQLEHANLFLVALDDKREWYRYHHLFADLLLARLDQLYPELVSHLHVLAAAWYEINGYDKDAIQHALAARDYPTAVRLVEVAAESAWLNGQYTRILDWTKAIPLELVHSHPWLCVWNGWATTQLGTSQGIDQWTAFAEQAAEEQSGETDSTATLENSQEALSLRSEIAALRAFSVSFSHAYAQAVEFAETVLETTPLTNQKGTQFTRCNILHLLSSMYFIIGHLQKAEQACQETITLAKEMDFTLRLVHATNKRILIHSVYGHLRQSDQIIEETLAYLGKQGFNNYFATLQLQLRKLELLYERNQLEAFQRLFELIQKQETQLEVPYLWVDICHIRALNCLIHQDYSGAQDALNKARALAQQTYIWEGLTWRTERLQVRLWLEQGELALAEAWIAEQAVDQTEVLRFPTETRAISQARILIMQGVCQEAIALLNRLSRSAEEEGRKGSLIELHILKACALYKLKELKQSLTEMESALDLAGPEGYMRIFLDEGQPMPKLLSLVASDATSLHANEALRLLSTFDHEHGNAGVNPQFQFSDKVQASMASNHAALMEPLSDREREVLHLMALGKTNQAIAQQLVVAPGTIKAHAASIYRKLDVANRTEAVARARQLGILP